MKMKSLFNPTDKDIENYRIAEIEFDQDGEPIYKDDKPVETGRTLEWSIKGKETLEFPEYVADYLVSIYGFLEEVKTEEKVGEVAAETPDVPKETVVAEPEKTGVYPCKHCGKSYKNGKGLGLHMGHTHPLELLK